LVFKRETQTIKTDGGGSAATAAAFRPRAH
jgi:hypothetical protein